MFVALILALNDGFFVQHMTHLYSKNDNGEFKKVGKCCRKSSPMFKRLLNYNNFNVDNLDVTNEFKKQFQDYARLKYTFTKAAIK